MYEIILDSSRFKSDTKYTSKLSDPVCSQRIRVWKLGTEEVWCKGRITTSTSPKEL